jgi:hypothetical protein
MYSLYIMHNKMFSISTKNILTVILGFLVFICGILIYYNYIRLSKQLDISKIILKREGDTP